MLWQNPLAFLGMLIAFSNAAPLAPLEGDIEDIINATYHSFDKRINEGVRYVFRTDGRDPKVLKSSGGFQTKGWTNGYREDVNLYRHCKGAKNGASMDDDGFVSTTWKRAVAEGWVRDHHKGSAWIYKIATDEGLIDVQATLKHYSPFPQEKEFAAIHSIPWAQVQGWYRYIKGVEYEYVRNKDFSQSQFGDLEHGGAQFPLAGFPKNHPAWSERPWSRYAHCRPKNAKREAEEIFAPQTPSDLDIDATVAIEAAPASHLEARARVKGSRTSRKRPSTTTRRKKTTKKTTKKPVKKPTTKPATGTKKCTAALQKAGKCKGAVTKCTAAMEKAGKCKTANTCSAVVKKQNGGVCPKCTVAEKKANGGVCPVCTAEEKKKNGGKCPAKKGDCGPSVSDKKRALEYMKALKAKRAGKKMKWSEGTTGTSTKGGKAGGKAAA